MLHNNLQNYAQLIKQILQKFIDDIDADNTNLNYEQQCNIIRVLSNVNLGQDNEMNNTQAADYLGVSRATFDNYIRDGLIPKGKQIGKFKELRWYKSDLDLFLIKQ